jgi:endonuclease/exonuclease/phosphatase family metal-dependent hydrolase
MPNILYASLLLAAVAVSAHAEPAPELIPISISSPAPADLDVHAQASTIKAGDRELTVLTYNVRGMPWPAAKRRKSALKAIGRELGEMRKAGRAPDIVLIQEGFENVDELVSLSGYRYAVSGPKRGDRSDAEKPAGAEGYKKVRYLTAGEGWGKLTSAGLHVLSDFPITGVQTQPYRYCAGWDCLANKGVMLAHIEVPGLPAGVDVVNTHMNSRGAAKVPRERTLQAHHLQMEELTAFIRRNRRPGVPLLVGGDFNVRHAPDRYDYQASARPFTVVSEYCKLGDNDCLAGPRGVAVKPWLESQDLQAFAAGEAVAIRPIKVGNMFDGRTEGDRLSDHDGYQVRYQLSLR